MKKIISLLTVLMLAAVSFPHAAFSEELNADAQFEISARSDRVKVSGNVTPAAEQKVAYTVLYPGKTLSDVTAADYENTVAAIGELKTNDNGEFDTEFTVRDKSADETDISNYPLKYKLCLSIDGYSKTIVKEFDFYGSKYIGKIIGNVNATKKGGDTAGMKNLIDTHYAAININNAIYESKIKNNDTNSAEFIRILTALPTVSETDLSELGGQFTEAAVLALINIAEDKDAVKQLINDYAAELKLDGTSEYKTYKEIIDDKLRGEVENHILSVKAYNTIDSFLKDVKTYIVMRSINGVIGWDNVRKSVETNADVIGIDLSLIKTGDSKADIYGRMINKNYSDYKAIADGFARAIEDSRKSTAYDSGKITGGGGGGGGKIGGGGSFPAGPTTNINSPIPETPDTADGYFNDLAGFEWAEEAINGLAEKNIINGKSNKMFAPSDFVLREEFVKMIVNAADMYDDTVKSEFADVYEGEWYYGFIASAVKNGLISGIGEKTFGIGTQIKREDMAVIIARLMGADSGTEVQSGMFTDENEISDYAKAAVAFAAENGIIKGDDGRFNPKAPLTRAEAAVVLYRYMAY